jgi:osmotically-inducible protein OsmY
MIDYRDERIRDEIRFRLRSDDEIEASKILVVVREGHVTLDGSVETRKHRSRAGDLAQSVEGVSSVKNRVVPKLGPLSELARRLRGKYAAVSRVRAG